MRETQTKSTNAGRAAKPRGVVLERKFYARSALVVARQLLGKVLVRRVDGRELAAPITETEAYIGPHDLACHASKGRTPQTREQRGRCADTFRVFTGSGRTAARVRPLPVSRAFISGKDLHHVVVQP